MTNIEQKVKKIVGAIGEAIHNRRVDGIAKSRESRTFHRNLAFLQKLPSVEELVDPFQSGKAELRGNMAVALEQNGDESVFRLEHTSGNNETLEIFMRKGVTQAINIRERNENLLNARYEGGEENQILQIDNPELQMEDENLSHIKDRYSKINVIVNRLITSMVLGKYPKAESGDGKIDMASLKEELETLSRTKGIPDKYLEPQFVVDGEHEQEQVQAIKIFNPFGDEIETIDIEDLSERSSLGESQRQYLTYLNTLDLRSHPYLKLAGLFIGAALFLSACGNIITEGSGEGSLSNNEWDELVENGSVDLYKADMMDLVGNDSAMTDGSKELLYAYLSSDQATDYIRGLWQSVSTPAELAKYGVVPEGNGTKIFRTREVNGGFSMFDAQSGTYNKFIAADTSQGVYLRQAYPNWQRAWSTIGMPQDMVSKIKLTGANPGEGVIINGREYVVLTTPKAGYTTLHTYYSQLTSSIGVEQANIQVLGILENYYLNVLMPMNQQGVIQRDINWKNIVMDKSTGVNRGIPIDLDGAVHMVDQRALVEWQYNQLAERAARRGVAMKPFSEFIAMHPDRFAGLNLSIGSTQILELSVSGLPVKVVIPQSYLAGLSGDALWTEIEKVQTQIAKEYRRVPQGGKITVEVNTLEGPKTIDIIKTTAYGDRIIGYGGKLGETIKFLKTGVKLAADVLFLMWIADEIGQITDPSFSVSFSSDVAFPDTVLSTKKDGLKLFLDGAFNKLIAAKRNLAADAAGVIGNNDEMSQPILGTDKQSLLRMITEYGLDQGQIYDLLIKKADASITPAPSDVQFQSPFPILVPGAREPINAYFSAVTDGSQNKLMVLWANQITDSGEQKLIPVASFYKETTDSEWGYQVLAEDEWSLNMTISGGLNLNLTCKPTGMEDNKFNMFCEVIK